MSATAVTDIHGRTTLNMAPSAEAEPCINLISNVP
jgi:hypothetical protein